MRRLPFVYVATEDDCDVILDSGQNGGTDKDNWNGSLTVAPSLIILFLKLSSAFVLRSRHYGGIGVWHERVNSVQKVSSD